MGLAYSQQAKYEQAIAEFEKAQRLDKSDNEPLVMIGYTYGLAGKRGEAVKVINALKERSRQYRVPPISFAIIYAGLGDKEQGFKFLQKAYEERSMAGLEVDYLLEKLHSDPRFTDLEKRVGFLQ